MLTMPMALPHLVVLCLPFVAALGGCGMPFQRTAPVTIEVIDAISGAPASDVDVIQHVQTGKFERSLGARATTDASGVAHIDAIAGVRRSSWRVGAAGPAYDGVGHGQIPAEFRPLAPSTADRRYRAPAWPAMRLRIELPEAYYGPVVEWTMAIDHARSSGWMPPSSIEDRHERVAAAAANGDGVVAYPSSINGVSGFSFVPERTVLRGGRPLWSVSANTQNPRLDVPPHFEQNGVVLWHIGYVDDRARTSVTPQGSSPGAGAPLVWFVGTEGDLRAWVKVNDLQAVRPAVRGKFDEIANARIFTRASLFKAIRTPADVTSAPEWELRPTDR